MIFPAAPRVAGPALLSILLLATAMSAQSSRIWPPGFSATRAGQDAMNTPFTVLSGTAPNNRVRNLTTIVGSTLPFRAGSVLTRLGFRRDARYTSTTYPAVSGGMVRVRIGTVYSGDEPDAAFEANWNTTPQLAADLTLNLPAAAPTTPAAPFALVIALAQPFLYTGGDLGIDLLFTGPGPTQWRRDAMSVAAGQTNGQFWTTGPGCTGSNGYSPYTWPEQSTAVPGGNLRVHVQGARRPTHPLETIALTFLGISATNFGGIPLPADLRGLGLRTGCFLRTDIVDAKAVVLDRPGTLMSRGSTEWPLPDDPSLPGLVLHTQWLLIDFGINTPLPVTVSNGIGINIGARDPNPRRRVGRSIWRYGACGCPNDGGMYSGKEYVPITEFTGNLL